MAVGSHCGSIANRVVISANQKDLILERQKVLHAGHDGIKSDFRAP